MQTALLCALSSARIGLGHIRRSLVLAKSLRDKGIRVVYLVKNLHGNSNDLASAAHFPTRELSGNDETLREAECREIAAIAAQERADIIILDTYACGIDEEKRLKDLTGLPLLVLDDIYTSHAADIVLNHNIYADATTYRSKRLISKDTLVLAGANYSLIDPSFISAPKTAKDIDLQNATIFLMMGGTDLRSLLPLFVEALCDLSEMSGTLLVATTSGNQALAKLREVVDDNQHRRLQPKLLVDPTDLPTLMASADFAICGAGSSTLELLATRTPFLFVELSENQRLISRFLRKNELGQTLGTYRSLTKKKIASHVIRFVDATLLQLRRRLQQTSHADGAANVVQRLLLREQRVAILIDPNSWLVAFVPKFCATMKQTFGFKEIAVLHDHSEATGFFCVFILSYGRIVPETVLSTNQHNLVVHESALPEGRGWSPLTWQILEGKHEIPICLFEAQGNVDRGRIYVRDLMSFSGTELVAELRQIQGKATMALCLRFLGAYPKILEQAVEQKGPSSSYPRRTPKDSELNIDLPLKDQIPLLRVVDNKRYPAHFYYKGRKYILAITAED